MSEDHKIRDEEKKLHEEVERLLQQAPPPQCLNAQQRREIWNSLSAELDRASLAPRSSQPTPQSRGRTTRHHLALWRTVLGLTGSLALLGIIFIWTTGSSTRAIADTFDALRAAISMTCEVTIDRPGRPPLRHLHRWVAPDLTRSDWGGDGEFVHRTEWTGNGSHTALNHVGPSAVIVENMSPEPSGMLQTIQYISHPEGLIDLLQDLIWVDQGRMERANGGPPLRLYRVEGNPDQAPMEIFIDERWDLPVEISAFAVNPLGDDNTPRLTTLRFTWNEHIEAALMTPELPEAVTPVILDGSIPAPPHLVRPRMGAGPILLGMSSAEVESFWGPADEIIEDGTHNYFNHGVQLLITPAGGVERIICTHRDARLGPFKTFTGKTSEGIEIGSTVKDVIAAYGEPNRIATFHPAGKDAFSNYYTNINFNFSPQGLVTMIVLVSNRED